MRPDELDPASAARSVAAMSSAPPPTLPQLALTYLRIGLIGFGGVNAWARRVIVEERRWLTDQEYAETLGLGQALPGPNALNVSIALGERWHGAAGAIIAPLSLFGGPLAVLILLAAAHDRWGEIAIVKATLAGVAAAAAGMIIGTALKMVGKLKPQPPVLAVGVAALIGAAWLRLPLPLIVLGLAPFGMAAAWWGMQKR
jgi:chromate transporter